ncbi:MAG: D-alanyl-D-alanine carboxypeptidase family protein [Oscillospiraceae bacterium]|jgi:D-alanyl-D-alanine carboxypeptidase|nr:D-alanyl-D-alanine carboxypeptidase family protein [Oscillospiraceae bacterium]
MRKHILRTFAALLAALTLLSAASCNRQIVTPTPSVTPIITPTAEPSATPSEPVPSESPPSHTPDDYGILLVNPSHPLANEYVPHDLVNLYSLKNRSYQLMRADIEIKKIVADAMQTMFAAAQKDGVDGFYITSGYRTRRRQIEIWNETTDGTAALPGTSEHETGLAFDVGSSENSDFEQTPQYRWLVQHCGEYGFILRYPRGAEDITGYPPESWHYRYVGLPHSQLIMARGITLEEYLGYA